MNIYKKVELPLIVVLGIGLFAISGAYALLASYNLVPGSSDAAAPQAGAFLLTGSCSGVSSNSSTSQGITVNLSWTPASDVKSYRILRKIGALASWKKLAELDASKLEYIDHPSGGKIVRYRVAAIHKSGRSRTKEIQIDTSKCANISGVLSPKGGESWPLQSTQTIKWTTPSSVPVSQGGKLSIQLVPVSPSIGGGGGGVITVIDATAVEYPWTISRVIVGGDATMPIQPGAYTLSLAFYDGTPCVGNEAPGSCTPPNLLTTLKSNSFNIVGETTSGNEVYLNQRFPLSQGQTVAVKNYHNLTLTFVRVVELVCFRAPCPPSKNLEFSAMIPDLKIPTEVFTLMPGQSKDFYGATISFLELSSSGQALMLVTQTVTQCKPRPACLDATPPCMMPEPVEGWCAKVTPTPSWIQVITPNGGEVWLKGQTTSIVWNSMPAPQIPNIVIWLRKGSAGSSPFRVISNTAPNQGFYMWKIPGDLPDGNDYTIYLSGKNSTTGEKFFDESDRSFSIISASTVCNPPIDCAAPPQGCNYQGGSTCACGALVCNQ